MQVKLFRSEQLRALMWVGPCVGAWALIPLLATNTGGLDSHQYLFWSSAVSAATLMICAAVGGHARTMRAYFNRTDLRRLTLLALLGAFGYYALLYAAYAPCPGDACPNKPRVIIIAQYTWPAFGVLWSAILLRDQLTSRIVVALAVGLGAVWVGATNGVGPGEAVAHGYAVAKLPIVLLAALMFGLYSALLRKFDYEPFSSLTCTFGAAAAMAFVAMLAMSTLEFRSPGWIGVQSVLINGMFVNGLSYVCWQRAIRAAPMTFVAPWISLTPVLAALITSEKGPVGAPGIGIVLVLISVLVATLPTYAKTVPSGSKLGSATGALR